MVDESKYERAMQIIACAGTAKSCALQAIDEAAEGHFEEAEALLAQAREQMTGAHDVQFSMISQEASGAPVELSIMLVHAEDHLTMSIMSVDLADRMVALYRRLAAPSASAVD